MSTLDLATTSAEAVKIDTAKTLLTGLIAQEIPTFGLAYLTGAACEPNLFKLWASVVPRNATDSVLVPGVPASLQRATDFHEFLITTGSGSENPGSLMLGTQLSFAPLPAARTTRVFYPSVARRTVALGAPLLPPTVTKLSAPYKRLQAVLTIPADDTSSVSIDYGTDQSGTSVSFLATLGWLGATAGAATPVTVALPDFSAVIGWDNTWAPSASAFAAWSVELVAGSGEPLLGRGREPCSRPGSKLAAICSELTAGARCAFRDACDGDNQQSLTMTKTSARPQRPRTLFLAVF